MINYYLSIQEHTYAWLLVFYIFHYLSSFFIQDGIAIHVRVAGLGWEYLKLVELHP